MRNLALFSITLVFAGACAHKSKTADKPITTKAPTTITPTATKDQSKGKKTKKTADAKPAPATPAKAEVEKAVKAEAEKPAAPVNAATVKCTSGKEERTLEIQTKGNGCELIYTKGGEAKSVGMSVNGTAHCQKISEKIQGNLTNAGYTCQ